MHTIARAFVLGTMFALVWAVVAPSAALAQSRVLTTQELTEQSDVVAVGKVSAMKSEWNTDKTRIITRVRINVREFLKGGGSDQSLDVVTLGGEVGDVGEFYSSTVRFYRDEEVVVFARKKSGRDHEVAGGPQGRVAIHEERGTGTKTVQRGVRLDEFRAQVLSAAQAARPGEKRP
jgi:hypothetical protein